MPIFFLLLLMMFCAGAGEMTMSQWSSAFAESALGVPKAVGDLFGPCLFALMMGSARAIYGALSSRINLHLWMLLGCVLCAASYLLAALAAAPALSLFGCAICGFSVGIFWPGILSRAAEAIPMGGISMFAILAMAGDLGCLIGPSAAGGIADLMGGDLSKGFLFAALFPAVCFFALLFYKYRRN
jgi:MFS family permease